MRKLRIKYLTFKRTARFAPESYDVFNADGNKVGWVKLENGTLTVFASTEKVDSLSNFEVSDFNMFHTEERRLKWLTKAGDKITEVLNLHG